MKQIFEIKYFLLMPIIFCLLIYFILNTRPLWLALFALVLVMMREIMSFRSRRLKEHKIFENGSVPSVGNKNIISGNYYEIVCARKTMETVKKYHDELGKTFGFFYGPAPWYLTMDDEVLQKVFIDGAHKHIDTFPLKAPEVSEINSMLTQLKGDEWRRVRQVLNPVFSHKNMKLDNVYEDVNKACDKLINLIQEHPKDDGGSGRRVDICYSAKRFAAEVIFRVAFCSEDKINFRWGERDKMLDSYEGAVRGLQNVFQALSVFSDTVRGLLSYVVKFSAHYRYMQSLLSPLGASVEERRARRASGATSGETRKMIDTMIDALDNKKIDLFTLKANLFFLFAAGFDTTSNVVCALCFYMAWHPPIQEKLREAILREGEEAVYLDYCLRETMRLFPPVPGVSRVLTEDVTTSSGQTLFKGHPVVACAYSIHYSAEYWGPDVEDFRPERHQEAIPATHWFSFGKGPRSCLGRNLALLEMKAVISKLMMKYRIETCETTPETMNWGDPNLVHVMIDGGVELRFVELKADNSV